MASLWLRTCFGGTQRDDSPLSKPPASYLFGCAQSSRSPNHGHTKEMIQLLPNQPAFSSLWLRLLISSLGLRLLIPSRWSRLIISSRWSRLIISSLWSCLHISSLWSCLHRPHAGRLRDGIRCGTPVQSSSKLPAPSQGTAFHCLPLCNHPERQGPLTVFVRVRAVVDLVCVRVRGCSQRSRRRCWPRSCTTGWWWGQPPARSTHPTTQPVLLLAPRESPGAVSG